MKNFLLSLIAFIAVSTIANAQFSYNPNLKDILLTPLQEDCVSFNPNNIEIVAFGIAGEYRILDGNHALFLFPNYTEAKKAYTIITQYGVNKSCFVGRPDPSFSYLLQDKSSPSGAVAGEDCLDFNPATIKVVQIDGRWKIVDGSHWLFDFNTSKSEAETAYKIIKKYGFTKSCYVGRPDPSLQYLRK